MELLISLFKFFGIYLLSLIAVLMIFALIDYDPSISIQAPILMGVSTWCAASYLKKKNYEISGYSKLALILVFWIGASMVDLLTGLFYLAITPENYSNSTIMSGFMFSGVLHLIVIAIFTQLAIKGELKKRSTEVSTVSD